MVLNKQPVNPSEVCQVGGHIYIYI
jgi:hypothetical protein